VEELLGTQGSMEERLRSKGIAQGPHRCREEGVCVHEAAASSIEREPTGSGTRVPRLLAGYAHPLPRDPPQLPLSGGLEAARFRRSGWRQVHQRPAEGAGPGSS
jgi:hypothetical protein